MLDCFTVHSFTDFQMFSPAKITQIPLLSSSHAAFLTWDKYYKTIFALIELTLIYGKILIHYFSH